MPRAPIRVDVMERLARNSATIPFSGCYIWLGGTTEQGYGRVSDNDGRVKMPHRIAYAREVGPIPDGHGVLHRCDVRSCWNPAHLFTGTQRDNALDSAAKGRHGMVKRTQCNHGHPLIKPEHFYIHNGVRRCYECHKANWTIQNHKRGKST